MSNVTEINAETGEVTVRPLTEEEIQRRSSMQRPEDPVLIQIDSPDPVKQAALLKLQALGLTEEEAKALAGM